LPASGGTDINLALLDAMAMVEPGRPTMVLFLTDGLPTEGEVEPARILENVAAAAPDNVRLFAFGVGDDVDTVLLDSLAQAHHGGSTYVRPGQALDETVSGFYAGISAPVLADVAIDFGEVHVEDIYPAPLPDLFAGSQLVVLGRYRAGGPATVTLTGEVNGRPERFVYEGQSFAGGGGEEFVPRLWATRKIGHLLNQIRLQGEDPELISAIVDLSVRFGVVTPYTSYLITEEDILTRSGREAAAEAAYDALAAAPEAPASGAAAVDEAQAQRSLADADVAAAPEATADGTEVVRLVGSRTFVLQDEVWVETTFDPETMTPTRVAFASEDYFALLAERPDLARAFALGERVIAVSGGEAYEVTA
jgi:Ca-activated chloride channel family protein